MNPSDTFYLVLSVSVVLLTIFLSIVLVYLMFILRDVNKVTQSAKETVEKVNHYVMQPIRFANQFATYLRPLWEKMEERLMERVTDNDEEEKPRRKGRKIASED